MSTFTRLCRLIGSTAFISALLLCAGCGGPEFLLPLEGDPDEARTLLTENDYTVDYRPGSVRTAERFFRALSEKDGATCWYLLDLRAAASWQAFQHGKKASEASEQSIISLLEPLFPSGPPNELERASKDQQAQDVSVRAEWTNGSSKTINLAMSHAGWRIVLPPPDTALAKVEQNPAPSDTAEPVNFEIDDEPEMEQGRPPSNPVGGGGGFGY